MAKKTVKKTTRMPLADPVEFNKWCVEIAIRWPTYTESGYPGALGGAAYGNARPGTHRDEDVIERAKKLREWVTTAA